ncbi:MAG: hypothetical protein NVV70_00945 [Cellulomonas sp.]|nr:hypothetical protein [Cellulomonas sp.]MCR6646766.1 hypothetical protein [Cellulomonas sp.]
MSQLPIEPVENSAATKLAPMTSATRASGSAMPVTTPSASESK